MTPGEWRNRLAALWERRPLPLLLALAALLRLAAALLSRGYGMHDDHFLVVELAQRWAEGRADLSAEMVAMRSLVYPWLHAELFAGLERVGITDPQGKMLVVRLLHAAWSLGTVYFGYRCALALSGPRAARAAGLLLAGFWIMPFMSVRNLVEVVCQPLLVAAGFFLVRGRRPDGGDGGRGGDAFVAGLLFGLAFVVRFQVLVLPATAGLVLLALRRFRSALSLALGAALAIGVVQGGSDWLGFGRPFASFLAYLAYNSNPANVAGYPQGPWFQYLGTLAGVLVPPTSLLLLWGFLRSARRAPLLFWPTVAFFVLHSAYPGKQERFLLPMVPYLLVLAAVGCFDPDLAPPFFARHRRLVLWLWRFFAVANTALLLVFTATYSKRSGVESLSYLHGESEVRGLVWETSEGSASFPPLFYLGKDVPVYLDWQGKPLAELREEIRSSGLAPPNRVVFVGARDLPARVERLSSVLGPLTLERTVAPSFYDWLLHRMNPRHNVNLTAFVYRAGG